MDHESCWVDLIFGRLDEVPVEIDLDQVGCCDLFEEKAVRIDEEVMFGSW